MKTTPQILTHPTKGFRPALTLKDAEKGMIEAVFSTFNVKDHDGDITMPGAFEDGAEVLISSYGHKSWWGDLPVGRGTIRVQKDKAILDGMFFLDTDGGRETFNVIKNTIGLQEWSYGFDVLKTGEVTEEMRQNGVVRVLEKLKVYEVSPVMLGAGIDTETLDAKSAKGGTERDPAIDQAARKAFADYSRIKAGLARRVTAR